MEKQDSGEDLLRVALTVLRVVRGWTQGELAQAAKVRPGTMSDYEQGKLVPSLRTLQRLTGVMGYPLAAIEEAQAFVIRLRAQSALRGAATFESSEAMKDGGHEVADDPSPEAPRRAARRWEIEQAAIEVGRTATRITRLWLSLQEAPSLERAPDRPSDDAVAPLR